MATGSFQDRLAALEAEVADLRSKLVKLEGPRKPWWEKIAGTFANDPLYAEAMKEGRKWRESFRPKSRKRRKS